MPRTVHRPSAEQFRRSQEQAARDLLLNRRIVSVRYMTDAEVEEMAWEGRPLVLLLDDGTTLYPSCDNEGNAAGALMGVAGPETAIANEPFRLATF